MAVERVDQRIPVRDGELPFDHSAHSYPVALGILNRSGTTSKTPEEPRVYLHQFGSWGTKLHQAVLSRNSSLVLSEVQRSKSSLNNAAHLGTTPLLLACQLNDRKVALTLIKAGASFDLIEIANVAGNQFAYDLARDYFRGGPIHRDSNSPLNPLFAQLIRFKRALGGSQHSNELSLNTTAAAGPDQFKIKYVGIYAFLLGMQALLPLDRREFLRRINQPNTTLYGNPATLLCKDMSGEVIHFEKGHGEADKIDRMLDLLLDEFSKANDPFLNPKERDERLLHFFEHAFDVTGKEYWCFDYKLNVMENYASRSIMKPDFVVDLRSDWSPAQKAFAYFTAFRNQQIDEMARSYKQTYSDLKRRIEDPSNIYERYQFYARWCTRARFDSFLQKETPYPRQEVFQSVARGDLDDYISPLEKTCLTRTLRAANLIFEFFQSLNLSN